MTSRDAARTLLRLAGVAAIVFVALGIIEDFATIRFVAYELSRRDLPRPMLVGTVIGGAYLLGILSLAILYTHRWRAVRWLAVAGTALTLAIFLGFKAVNGYGFTIHEATLLWLERDTADEALRFFVGLYLLPIAVGVTVALVLGWLASRMVRLRSVAWLLIPLLSLPVQAYLVRKTHSRIYQSPVPYRVPLLTVFAALYSNPWYGRREAPSLAPQEPPLADHVLVVIEESVRGDFLGINGAPFRTTPYLRSIRDRLLNYGVASSATNLSATANLILLSGIQARDLPDRHFVSLKSPSLFGYAEAAGFSTFLVDDQLDDDRPPDYLTGFDLADLDGHYRVRRLEAGARPHELDRRALDYLEKIVRENDHSFTWLLKQGAHFPYGDKFTEDVRLKPPGGDDARAAQRVLYEYLSAVRYACDGFFAELVPRLDATGERVLVIYTSDHGQSVLESLGDGERLTGAPHATVFDPPPTQAAVPLFLVPFGPGVREAVASRYRPELRDRVTAFSIFPTVLVALGYPPGPVRARYGPSLFDPDAAPDERIFLSGSVFGQGGAWSRNRFVLEPSATARPGALRGSGSDVGAADEPPAATPAAEPLGGG